MTTLTEARSVLRERMEAGNIVDGDDVAVPLRWQNETGDPLPNEPAPFVYTEVLAEPAELVSYGGGRGDNRYRHPAVMVSHVFVPRGEGLDEAEEIGEQIAGLFRSYRDADVSCFDATVYPGGDGSMVAPRGFDSDVGNYHWASVEVRLFFDLIG